MEQFDLKMVKKKHLLELKIIKLLRLEKLVKKNV